MALFGRKKNQPVEPVVVKEPEALPDAPEPRADGLRAMKAHRDYLLSLVEPLPDFGMKVLDAVGLQLIEDLSSHQDIPAMDRASVEGYAVLSTDLADAAEGNPVTLPVAGTIGIGQQATGETEPGECVHLVAGAPMPRGTDAVVPFDRVRGYDDDATFTAPVHPGANVRARGADVTDGETLLRKGDRLDPRIVGLLAAAGVDRVMARPRPRVVVIATGAELVEPGQRLVRDVDTYDANSYLLAAAARDLGADVYRAGVYTTDPEKIREAITDQLIRADLIISTGGVSRDDYDLVRSVLPELGPTDFCEVAMSPGQAQGFGLIGPDRVPMVMLPGNPISAYVSFQAFVRPLIRKLMGVEPFVEKFATATTGTIVRGVPGKVTWLRGHVDDEGGRRLVEPFPNQSGHQLGDLAQANCLIMLDGEADHVPAGEPVRILLLDQE